MGRYLIDNNAISNFLSGQLTDNGMNFMAEVVDQIPIISVITQIEALSWVNYDKTKEQVLKNFVHDAIILSLTPEIVEQCVRIRRSKKMKTRDAIIAATAIINDFILISSDNDFTVISGLKVLNPKSL
jgi:predicted nucleic acid-binding protein